MSPNYFNIALNGFGFQQEVIYTCYARYAFFSLDMDFDQSKTSAGLLPLGHSMNSDVKLQYYHITLTFYIILNAQCSCL